MASYASMQSTAVDYQRFSPQRQREEAAEAPQLEVLGRRKTKRQARASYGRYIFVGLCVFGVLMLIIFNYMSVNELVAQNDRIRSQISALKGEENALNAKKEQIYNLAFVEEYAKNTLGMIKLDKSEIRYVELSNPERMIVAQGGDGTPVSGLAKSLSAVLEYLN